TMTSGRNVTASEVRYHGQPGSLSDPGRLTELQGPACSRSLDPVEHRLAVRRNHLGGTPAQLQIGQCGSLRERFAHARVDATHGLDGRGCGWEQSGDRRPKIGRVRHAERAEWPKDKVGTSQYEVGGGRFDRIKGCPRDQADDSHGAIV